MKLIEAMKAKFAYDESREKMEEQAALAARLRHEMLNRHMSEKQIVNEQQRQEELRQWKETKCKEEYRKKDIEEARKRLLEQHATK